jgi:Cytochrome c
LRRRRRFSHRFREAAKRSPFQPAVVSSAQSDPLPPTCYLTVFVAVVFRSLAVCVLRGPAVLNWRPFPLFGAPRRSDGKGLPFCYSYAVVGSYAMTRLSTALAFTLLIGLGGPSAAQAPLSQWDGVFTDEQAARGRVLYEQRCASCHGRDLQGVLLPQHYPGERSVVPLVGADFDWRWNGLSLNIISERVRLSMPQNNPGSLNRQQNADILAFILQSGGFPPGATELQPSAEALIRIDFRARR